MTCGESLHMFSECGRLDVMIGNTDPHGHSTTSANAVSARRSRPPSAAGLEVMRLAGVGAMSTVWLARVTGEGPGWIDAETAPGLVALKVAGGVTGAGTLSSPGSSAEEATVARRLRAELEAMVPLRHEHLVNAYGFSATSHGPGLLLEPFIAGSLGRILSARRRLTPGETVTVLSPIAQALSHLHRAGVAHGDVSPGNVLLAPDGRPALADLGDVQLLGMPRTSTGTPGFLAPERDDALRAAEHGVAGNALGAALAPEADVYSLAALAWFTLTGSPPVDVPARPPLGTLCPSAPLNMIELLEAGLSRMPRDRPSAAEFGVEFYRSARAEPLDLTPHVDDDVLPDLPTVAGAVQRGDRGRTRRHRMIAGLGAAVVVAAGVSLVVDRTPTSDPSPHDVQKAAQDDDVEDSRESVSVPTPESEAEQPEASEGLLRGDDPLEALEHLAGLRTAVLRSPEHGRPEDYSVEGSPVATADAELLQRWAATELAYEGDPMLISPTSEVRPSETITGDAESGAIEVIDVDAEVRMSGLFGEERLEQHVEIVLQRSGDGPWLLYSVHDLSEDAP